MKDTRSKKEAKYTSRKAYPILVNKFGDDLFQEGLFVSGGNRAVYPASSSFSAVCTGYGIFL